MTNYNKKKPLKQSERRFKIEAAKKEWFEFSSILEEEKNILGYAHLSQEQFLELPLDENNHERSSKVIALQKQYIEHDERRKHIWAEDDAINELNKSHAVVNFEQTYILTEKINALGFRDFSLQSKQSFRAFYENKVIDCIDGAERCKADIWFKSPCRREYTGIIFNPSIVGSADGDYNLWQGFTCKAIQGNCDLFWNHVKDNICNSDEGLYTYVRRWVASVFQKPDKIHTALVIVGSQGIGKNRFVEPLGKLLGNHYVPLSSIHELLSNFNFHLKYGVLIHANEALWGGNKKELGTIKAMITESTCLIEGKGKDSITVPNFKHVILSSNEDWPVHIDSDDRRFCAIPASDKRKEDHAYFKALQDQLDNGGYEALLYELLNEDLTAFNPREIPCTANSFDIKMRSTDSSLRYLYEVLKEGGFSIGKNTDEGTVWQGQIPKDMVYEDYTAWCFASGEKSITKPLFGKALSKTITTMKVARPNTGIRVRCYVFPSLEKTREEFCRAFKTEVHLIFNEETL